MLMSVLFVDKGGIKKSKKERREKEKGKMKEGEQSGSGRTFK